MTTKRRGTAVWRGELDTGDGNVSSDSAVLDAAYDAASRFADGGQTNPEELIAAAHAACYSMALAGLLDEAGYDPDNVSTDADVELETGEEPRITRIRLTARGRADEIDEETFREFAEKAKVECPVSVALGSLPVEVRASLETPTPG